MHISGRLNNSDDTWTRKNRPALKKLRFTLATQPEFKILLGRFNQTTWNDYQNHKREQRSTKSTRNAYQYICSAMVVVQQHASWAREYTLMHSVCASLSVSLWSTLVHISCSSDASWLVVQVECSCFCKNVLRFVVVVDVVVVCSFYCLIYAKESFILAKLKRNNII